jgi:hypothetical protein
MGRSLRPGFAFGQRVTRSSHRPDDEVARLVEDGLSTLRPAAISACSAASAACAPALDRRAQVLGQDLAGVTAEGEDEGRPGGEPAAAGGDDGGGAARLLGRRGRPRSPPARRRRERATSGHEVPRVHGERAGQDEVRHFLRFPEASFSLIFPSRK